MVCEPACARSKATLLFVFFIRSVGRSAVFRCVVGNHMNPTQRVEYHRAAITMVAARMHLHYVMEHMAVSILLCSVLFSSWL